jgi:tetratricopeptide (TPR) repeat protein
MTITLLLIFAAFAFTQYIVNLHRGTEAALAHRWFHRGNEAMQANLPVLAANDYRTALSYDRENQEYRLRLAEALSAGDRLAEARAHLLSLWEEEPASGEVNLALARLDVRRGNAAEATRYYDNAIDGVWDEEPRKQRIATRFELVRYLLQRHDLAKARAELLALQADGPPDTADQLLLGQLLLQVNEPQHAIGAFDAALAASPGNADAWFGKGLAYLQLGQDSDAEHALAEAVERNPKLTDAGTQLDIVREMLRLNPAMRGLSLAERSKRVAEAFRTAMSRLNSCAAQQGYRLDEPNITSAETAVPSATGKTNGPPAINVTVSAPNNLQLLYSSGKEKEGHATEQELRKNPDSLEPMMQYVFEVERATTPVCPVTDVADRALLNLAQHESETLK